MSATASVAQVNGSDATAHGARSLPPTTIVTSPTRPRFSRSARTAASTWVPVGSGVSGARFIAEQPVVVLSCPEVAPLHARLTNRRFARVATRLAKPSRVVPAGVAPSAGRKPAAYESPNDTYTRSTGGGAEEEVDVGGGVRSGSLVHAPRNTT